MHCAHLGRTLPPPPEQSKRILRDRPSLLLFNLSMLVMCTTNHWFESSGTDLVGAGFSDSSALSTDLRQAIQTFADGDGSGHALLQGWFDEDLQLSRQHERERLESARQARRNMLAKRAANTDELGQVELFATPSAVRAFAVAEGQGRGEAIRQLKLQIRARTQLRQWKYSIKPKVTPPRGKNELEFLIEQVTTCIEEDIKQQRSFDLPTAAAPLREPPLHPRPTLQALERAAEVQRLNEQLQPQDDDELVDREKEFVGKCLFDEDSHETLQVAAVRFRKYGRREYWVVECRKVDMDHEGNPHPAKVVRNAKGQLVLFAYGDGADAPRPQLELVDYLVHTEANMNDVRGDMQKYVDTYGQSQPTLEEM